MPSIRIGYSTEFVLRNELVGIGSTATSSRLDVAGQIRSENTAGSGGVSTFREYQGFSQTEAELSNEVLIENGSSGPYSSLTGEIKITGETTVSSGSTVEVGKTKTLTVTDKFAVPLGDTSTRDNAPEAGTTRFNQDFGTLEFFDGVNWKTVNSYARPGGAAGRAVFGGGYIDGNTRTIDMQLINIPTLGNATYFGDLARDLSTDGRGVGSAVRGILGGGYGKQTPGGSVGRLDDMDYFTIASEGNAIDFGNLTQERNGLGAVSSSTRGIFCGGAAPSPAVNSVNTMDYIQISTTGNALDFGDLAKEKSASGCLVNSPTRGIVGAGDDYSGGWQYTALGHLDAVTMASKGNAVDFGTDVVSRIQGAGCGNAVRGCFAGGYVSDQYASPAPAREAGRAMTVISISTFGNSVEFGTLSSGARIYLGAASSNTRGIWTGGSQYPVHFNEIEYTQFASLGDSIDFGDLTRNKGYMQAATSDSHGGLGGF